VSMGHGPQIIGAFLYKVQRGGAKADFADGRRWILRRQRCGKAHPTSLVGPPRTSESRRGLRP
jgi:hypothetical protein